MAAHPIAIPWTVTCSACDGTCFLMYFHAPKIKHKNVALEHTFLDGFISAHKLRLLGGQLLCTPVHTWVFCVGEKPLNVPVVGLETTVLSEPLGVDVVHEIAIGDGATVTTRDSDGNDEIMMMMVMMIGMMRIIMIVVVAIMMMRSRSRRKREVKRDDE